MSSDKISVCFNFNKKKLIKMGFDKNKTEEVSSAS